MTSTAQQNKNPLPYSCTKGQLINMYIDQMPEVTIRVGMNAIIEDNRKNFATKAKFAKRIFHTELVDFIDIYGMPKNYFKPENW